MTIGELRKTVPHELNEAYNQAIEAIQSESSTIEGNRILLKYCGALQRTSDNEFDQRYAALNVLTVFEMMYNALVYTLQKDCGFHCEKIIVMDHIFLLLNCSDENLMRAAQKYGLKKEVLYSQIDIALNEPLDAKLRPLRFNSFLLHPEEESASAPASIAVTDEIFELEKHKKEYRRINNAPAIDDIEYIQEQKPLTKRER